MGEVALARLWQLADGTTCVLVKDSRAENWQLRITRAEKTLRNETFGNPLVAMTIAKQWREAFAPVSAPR
jgi:hypothetical protein